MKTYITAIAALALCAGSDFAFAQNKQKTTDKKVKETEETIVIRKGNGNNTTVEIKDGEVYINGEKIANTEKSNGTLHKKIIINNDGSAPRDMMPFKDDFETDIPRKAMLGIYTKIDENKNGAQIDQVMPNSAADKAGLMDGDVITKIDNTDIKDGKQLTELISKHDAGDKVSITYQRNGKTLNTEASLSDAPGQSYARIYKYGPDTKEFNIPNPMMRPPFLLDINDDARDASPKMGAMVEELADNNGVRVLDIRANSPAMEAGLQKDDVIKRLDNENILSIDDLQSVIHGVKRNEKIKLQYERQGKNMNTTIIFPKATRKKDL